MRNDGFSGQVEIMVFRIDFLHVCQDAELFDIDQVAVAETLKIDTLQRPVLAVSLQHPQGGTDRQIR